MSMMINFHGGQCCGIKTISHLYKSPTDVCWPKTSHKKADHDARGHTVSSDQNFYHLSRPKETAGERFKAYMDFLRKNRPHGLVEVTIVPYLNEAAVPEEIKKERPYLISKYQADWVPFLIEQGFTRVQRFKNSNSGNYVEVWHYVMEEEFNYEKKFGHLWDSPEYEDDYYDDDDDCFDCYEDCEED